MVLGSVGDIQRGSIVPPLHSGVGGAVFKSGKQSKKARPYSKTVRLVGPLWMTSSSERQNQ